MPDENQVENIIANIGVSAFQTGLAGAINDTYSFANSSLFLACIGGYYRDYAQRYVKPACQWLDGFVPSIHNTGTGIISTRIAGKLISGLTKQIVGEKLVFRLKSKPNEDGFATLKKVAEWATKEKVHKAVKNGVGFACGIGTSLVKINRRIDGSCWWEPVRFDNCFYLASFNGEVEDATFLIRGYTDTRKGKNTHFFLCEHRFWHTFDGQLEKVIKPDGTITYEVLHKKGDREARVEYTVHRANSQSLNNLMASQSGRSGIGWSEIPDEIKRLIKNDYAALRIGEPQPLGFPNLACEPLLNGEGDLSVPTGSNFGESMIVGIQDDLIVYELATSYLIRDMYNGKGTVYLPKSLSIGDIGGAFPTAAPGAIAPTPSADGGIRSDGSNIVNSGGATSFIPAIDSPYNGMPDKVETLPGVSPEQQQAIVNQFDLRGQEWQLIKENALKNIAVKWGMSPKILSSFLAQGTAQMTATQIDSEDDISIAFINLERSNFKEPLNRLLETTLNYMGLAANVELDFASPSLINKDRLLNRTLEQLEKGLIDIEEAVRIMNPDLDEETLQNKIKIAKDEQQRKMLEQVNEMMESGGFGGLSDDMLKGSTVPH